MQEAKGRSRKRLQRRCAPSFPTRKVAGRGGWSNTSQQEVADGLGRQHGRDEPSQADGGSRGEDGGTKDPLFPIRLLLVVEAEETGVQTHSKENLRRDAEQEEDPEHTVVCRGKVASKNVHQKKVDNPRKDVGRAVDDGVLSQRLELLA